MPCSFLDCYIVIRLCCGSIKTWQLPRKEKTSSSEFESRRLRRRLRRRHQSPRLRVSSARKSPVIRLEGAVALPPPPSRKEPTGAVTTKTLPGTSRHTPPVAMSNRFHLRRRSLPWRRIKGRPRLRLFATNRDRSRRTRRCYYIRCRIPLCRLENLYTGDG